MQLRPRTRWAAAAVVSLLALFALAGCQVNTAVSVRAGADGHGTVSVSVAMDPSAVDAAGGAAALAAQLDDADLVAEGWTVTGPSPGPHSTTVVSASHAYTTPAEASQLVADVAGSGPESGRPFRLALDRHRDFWQVHTYMSGTVDLACGLNCFGDSGLQSALGSPTGVNPAPLEARSGESPDQVFTFAVTARLPGSVASSNASSDDGGVLTWTPRLGQTLVLSATTKSWNWSHLIAVIVVGGLVLAALLAFLLMKWRSRRRKRKGGDESRPVSRPSLRRGAHAKSRRGSGSSSAVTSPF